MLVTLQAPRRQRETDEEVVDQRCQIAEINHAARIPVTVGLLQAYRWCETDKQVIDQDRKIAEINNFSRTPVNVSGYPVTTWFADGHELIHRNISEYLHNTARP